MARTIHEIDVARQRVGACDMIGKMFVEEPPGSTHDPIVAAEAAAIARELETAIASVIAAHAPVVPAPLEVAPGSALEGVLKK
ncbi:MAG TPA: hypothetical protein VM032_09755 [Vicinamibacterales bacterium]|nr:hypothetical protein [Vicinamibacterales bacterium]